MSDRNYLAEIEEIDRQHKELMELRKGIINEWITAEHPLKMGDVVVCNRYSSSSKKMAVTNVQVKKDWLGFWIWLASGKILKKDGTPGLMKGEWAERVEADDAC